jgi:hypothetical protein
MGFTLQTLDNGLFILEIPLNQIINIFKTGEHADEQKDNREIRERPVFLVQPVAEIETSKDRQDHGDADTAGITHLDERFFIQLTHGCRAS